MLGISLPVNVIIIIAIAVLVMVAVASFFTQNAASGISSIERKAGISEGCSTFKTLFSCRQESLSSVSVRIREEERSLVNLCREDGLDQEQCFRRCACLDLGSTTQVNPEDQVPEIIERGDSIVVGVGIL